ncbi:hypothetical protein [Brevibacillus centrosporus]|uniref:Uncharacterized protein n=1 Tax=Brevibacillus centrosporus TaxID=54910 RepID=A0A1I3WC21_9BACL|nr:hypothetical protein [Brevibacillus centrosporus]MEC2130932.1 hypothetical protein [Brevibacillus centrosporus]MED4907553.1 hypothetical protein [Brevibacillus centrosporus]RNB63405.1 hypothetical protein EDM55_28945 [Brevibacillus centrosporus]SFK04779.1 hypothetical protein SAMN05518846_10836 [Brevibacillus centrosporus]GED31355.1 hypothetical protein BCE02nite_24960 [Brevibacillus centrosporus]
MRDYLVYCTYCSSYTLLHSFDKDSGSFLGEYSLLHNDYTRNSVVLNKFLLSHLGHTIRSIPSKTEDYRNIICTASHFLEDDIDKYVEESQDRMRFSERNRKSEREIGQVQLYLVEHLLTHELQMMTQTRASTPAEGQVMLGKELGLKQSLEVLRKVRSDKQFA